MKAHTSDFKNGLKNLGRQFKDTITYIKNGSEITLSNELYSVTPHFESNILKSVMKELEFESSVSLELNTEIIYNLGLLVNGSYEFLNYGTYIVYNVEKKEDEDKYVIQCYDKMLYSMKNYEELGIQFPCDLRTYINGICTKIGLTFANASSTFANYNRTIQTELYLDSQGNDIGYTFRDALDEIAEATGSTVIINDNDELELKYITNTYDTINEEFLKDVNVKFGEAYGPVNAIVLSRSGEADNVYRKNQQSIDDNGLTEIKIVDNQIMNGNDRADYLDDLYTILNGLTYSLNDFSSTGILYYDVCDRYNVEIGNNSYSCVFFNNEIERKDGLQESIYTEMPDKTQTDYTKADKDDRRIKKTYLLVDKQNQIIKGVIENVSEQNNKIAIISANVEEINTKIRDIADITTSGETMYATLNLISVNESEPIELKVHANLVDIRCLYPCSNLYPSSNTYLQTRTVRFSNTTTNEFFDYILPDDLLYLNQNVYDEFILNYDSQTCQIIKRCELNSSGTVVAKSTPVTNTYPYPSIYLTDGNYTVSLPGYNYGYLFVRCMASNIYTSQFATKVELNSKITQTENEINATVSLKLDETDFTHASIVAKINDDTSQALIDADKINISANDVLNILAGNTLNLTSKSISITSTNFSVTTNGTVNMRNAVISGTFSNYDSNGWLAVKISQQKINLYDWKNNGIWVGSISSVYRQSNQQSGISLITQQGDDLILGYKVSESSTEINTLMRFDTSDLTKTPFIVNTANGKIFPNLPNGGIEVENGFIKSWNLNGVKTGKIALGNDGIEIKSGLITNWDIGGASGTLFPNTDGGGIVVKNGIITSWNINNTTGTIPLGRNGITVKSGLVTDWGIYGISGTYYFVDQHGNYKGITIENGIITDISVWGG